ncbi:uncharacterized protein LOC134233666 [Saccostrea cucullata]|uniref:uncharacterized protein LOC134233666 n=1 Tax=Saccostrea cuccullata TaxID=36930 RepID=UPI002ED4AEC8
MATLLFVKSWIFFCVTSCQLITVESCWSSSNFTLLFSCEDTNGSNFEYRPVLGVFGFGFLLLLIVLICCKERKQSSQETTNIRHADTSPARTNTVNNGSGMPRFGYPTTENPIFGQYDDQEQHVYCLPALPQYEAPPKYSTLPRHTSLPENMPPPPEYDSSCV